jgi:hypothetical protein
MKEGLYSCVKSKSSWCLTDLLRFLNLLDGAICRDGSLNGRVRLALSNQGQANQTGILSQPMFSLATAWFVPLIPSFVGLMTTERHK